MSAHVHNDGEGAGGRKGPLLTDSTKVTKQMALQGHIASLDMTPLGW
jgi:hypothetical protein